MLVPIDRYDTLLDVQRPVESWMFPMKSSVAGNKRFEMVESAIRGIHAKITLYDNPIAVVIPVEWYGTRGGQLDSLAVHWVSKILVEGDFWVRQVCDVSFTEQVGLRRLLRPQEGHSRVRHAPWPSMMPSIRHRQPVGCQ